VGRDEIGEQLAGWGKVALIETRGRRSGQPARAAVHFVDDGAGGLLIAAGSPDADWALNLLAHPRCRATVGDVAADYHAEPVDDDAERGVALTALILKYGTPAERLGAGPVFRLRQIAVPG
jgi:deazaflavin-dependent oxidoreductase (nitroreductase family)